MAELFSIEPRDPLVFGGFQPPNAASAPPPTLPPQSTLAGMVRTCFATSGATVEPATAQELLRIAIRGPLIWQGPSADLPDGQFWAPAPVDCLVEPCGTTVVSASLVELGALGGALWPKGTPTSVDYGFYAPLKNDQGEKRQRLSAPLRYWSWDSLVTWALGQCVTGPVGLPSICRFQSEDREHVVIDDDTGTAVPGALFRNPAVRFPPSFRLVVEVDPQGHDVPDDLGWVTLGGEARLSRMERSTVKLPSFPAARYREVIERGPIPWVRLQLLTPAVFSQASSDTPWLPSWVGPDGIGTFPGTPGPALKLRAACILGFEARSGWNLQRVNNTRSKGGAPFGSEGGPRKVQRLVPAGCVYVFEPLGTTAEAMLVLCEHLWLASMETGTRGTNTASGADIAGETARESTDKNMGPWGTFANGLKGHHQPESEATLQRPSSDPRRRDGDNYDDGSFRAPPDRDGYGLILPGLQIPEKTEHGGNP